MVGRTDTVFIVDDDESVRESVQALVEFDGRNVRTFASATEFLAAGPGGGPSCLILDIGLPGLNGLQAQEALADQGMEMPVIFITGDCDVPTSVRAMKAGAVELLTKPFEDTALLAAVDRALERSRAVLPERLELQALRERYGALTDREREVMALVVSGLLNKQIAGRLGISEITVKAHRGRMMEKMKAHSLPELVRMGARLRMGGSAASHGAELRPLRPDAG